MISLGRTLLQDVYAATPLASSTIPTETLFESAYSSSSSRPDETLRILQQTPTSKEIASYFALIHPLKYSQPHEPLPSPFSPPLNGLTITAYNAGHTLGGTIWHLQHGMESVVYAVHWNQIRDNMLSGAAWLDGSGSEIIEQLRKPTAMICSTRGAERNPLSAGRKRRDDLLLDMIRSSTSKGGTVLIPTDTSARVLELAYTLEHAWRRELREGGNENPLKGVKLYVVTRSIASTLRYARSMLEWMDENVMKAFEAESSKNTNQQHRRNDSKQLRNREKQEDVARKDAGPFEFRYLKFLERKKHFEKVMSAKGPSVIIASDAGLDWGYSKDALQSIAADPSNLMILTQEYSVRTDPIAPQSNGLAATIWDWYRERRDGVAVEQGSNGTELEQVYTGSQELILDEVERVQLEGKELAVYQQYLATQRRLSDNAKSATGAQLETSADALDDTSSTSSSSSEESDSERQGKALNTSAAVAQFNRIKVAPTRETLGVNILLREPGVYDYDVRGKKGREQMFPFISKRRRADDFGEVIRPEDYLRAEERDQIDAQDLRDGKSGHQAGLGQKRKWGDSGLQNGAALEVSADPRKRKHQRLASGEKGQLNGTNETVTTNGVIDKDEEYFSDESDVEDDSLPPGPSKIISKRISVNAQFRIAYVDFEGMHDRRSLSMLIPLIQPRKLILVGGSLSETETLANEFRHKLSSIGEGSIESMTHGIYTPVNGQATNASVDTLAWMVKLSNDLVRRFHWQNVRGLGVVTLIGLLAATTRDDPTLAEAVNKKRQRLAKEAEDSKLVQIATRTEAAAEPPPTLDLLPANLAAATHSVGQPLHVGDLRLADLRKVLQAAGHTAEFRGEGTLLIDGLIAIRKSGTGWIEVESGAFEIPNFRARNVEEPFLAVKRKIYEGLAIIAGG